MLLNKEIKSNNVRFVGGQIGDAVSIRKPTKCKKKQKDIYIFNFKIVFPLKPLSIYI